MNQKPNTKQISLNLADNTIATIDSKSIMVKDLLKMTQEGILLKNTDTNNINQNIEIWANLSIDNLDLSKFETRSKSIKNILSIAMKNDIKGINIIATSENNNLERFIIELAPQLREIGIKTNIVENEYFSNIDFEKYKDIVDYVIK